VVVEASCTPNTSFKHITHNYLDAENTLKLMENISMRLQGKFHNNTLKDCFVSSTKTKTNMTRMSAVIALSEHVGNCGLPQVHCHMRIL
jgi:hypothetical protein